MVPEKEKMVRKKICRFNVPGRQIYSRLLQVGLRSNTNRSAVLISGIIPEWQEASDKEKRGTIEIMKLWTGDLMNSARIQMKNWVGKK
eukprot:1996893-Pleurochrysis_carterae.AAC.1